MMAEKVVIGNAELWHGDCREVLPLLPRFAAVVTDPPYGLADLLHRPGTGQWEKHYKQGAPTWDRVTVADGVTAALAQADKAVVWGGQFYLLTPSRCWLSWNKILRNWSSSEALQQNCEDPETMKQTQGRAIIAERHSLREDEQLVKGRHQPSDLVTWRVVPAPRNRQQERI